MSRFFLLTVNPPKKTTRSASVGCISPLGIPLGTLTAQIASKSFWNQDMFNDALKHMSHTTLLHPVSEKSGSTPGRKDNQEDLDTDNEGNCEAEESSESEEEEEEEEEEEDKSEHSHPVLLHERKDLNKANEREWRVPCSRPRSHWHGDRTPPYLSPGITRRFRHSKSLNSMEHTLIKGFT